METKRRIVSTHDKAVEINLDEAKYGTFVEIGAGQEVARWFFHVGGAAATVAKTMSAYDMAVSDAIYGPAKRYVSRERLIAMLDHEWDLLATRLDADRGSTTKFFVFADTVVARSYSHRSDGHGWLGIRFQTEPRGAPSDVKIHVRLLDRVNAQEQESLGIIGVNLLHAALHLHADPLSIIDALLDDLTLDRVNMDMIEFSGPAFQEVDNRLMALQLVEKGFTEIAAFTAEGHVIPPGDLMHKKALLVDRGSFRPLTNVTMDMLKSARARFVSEPDVDENDVLLLMEMTLNNLLKSDTPSHKDFLDRVDILSNLGQAVAISNYGEYHRLASYLTEQTDKKVAIVMGTPTLDRLFDEQYYRDLAGGILESFGRLFKANVRLYVYPFKDPRTGEVMTAGNLQVAEHLRDLYAYLLHAGCIEVLEPVSNGNLGLSSEDVMSRLAKGDPSWEDMVPAATVDMIKKRALFGYKSKYRY